MPIGPRTWSLHVLLIGLAGRFFDDAPQDTVPEVRIGMLRARREVQGPPHRITYDGLRTRWERRAERRGRFTDTVRRVRAATRVPSSGVMQEMPHGDAPEPRVDHRTFRRLQRIKQAERTRIEVKLAFLDQLQNGHGGDGLGHAPDAEQAVRLHGLPRSLIRKPVAFGVDEPFVPGDCDGPARQVPSGHQGFERAVQAREIRGSAQQVNEDCRRYWERCHLSSESCLQFNTLQLI